MSPYPRSRPKDPISKALEFGSVAEKPIVVGAQNLSGPESLVKALRSVNEHVWNLIWFMW